MTIFTFRPNDTARELFNNVASEVSFSSSADPHTLMQNALGLRDYIDFIDNKSLPEGGGDVTVRQGRKRVVIGTLGEETDQGAPLLRRVL